MKRKCLLILTILVLAIFFSGCSGGITTPSTDGAKIENVIQEYYLALSDQNWSKAKSYCIYVSDLYNEVIQWENIVNTYPYCDVIIAIYPTILDYGFDDEGILSCVHCYINDFSTACGNNINNTQSYYIYLHLKKVGNSWKLYEKHT